MPMKELQGRLAWSICKLWKVKPRRGEREIDGDGDGVLRDDVDAHNDEVLMRLRGDLG